jgi:tetratricopeptide (TPR) repeat protein
VQQTLVARAIDAYKAKKYEKSACGFSRALEVIPSNPSPLYNLSCSLALLGNQDAAIECLAAVWRAGFQDIERLLSHRRGSHRLRLIH